MDLYDAKRGAAVLLAALNLVLLVWAVLIARRRDRKVVPDSYVRLLRISPVVAGLQVLFGLVFVGQDIAPPVMHIFYGSLTAAGGLAQALLGSGGRVRLGQQYRGRPLVYAFLALLVGLLALRSWMAAR